MQPLPTPRLATDRQLLAAGLLDTRRAAYEQALTALAAARTPKATLLYQQLVGFRLNELNATLDALNLEPQPAPVLTPASELVAADFTTCYTCQQQCLGRLQAS
jgi:hypothetical protein